MARSGRRWRVDQPGGFLCVRSRAVARCPLSSPPAAPLKPSVRRLIRHLVSCKLGDSNDGIERVLPFPCYEVSTDDHRRYHARSCAMASRLTPIHIIGLSLFVLFLISCGGQQAAPISVVPTAPPIPTAIPLPTAIPTPATPTVTGRVFRSDNNAPIVGAIVYLIEAKSGGNNGEAMVDGHKIDPSIGNDPTKDSSTHIVANTKTDKEGKYLLKDISQGKYRMWVEMAYDNAQGAPCYPFSFATGQFADDPNFFLLMSMAFTPDGKWLTMYRKEGAKITNSASLAEPFQIDSTEAKQYDVDMVCKRK